MVRVFLFALVLLAFLSTSLAFAEDPVSQEQQYLDVLDTVALSSGSAEITTFINGKKAEFKDLAEQLLAARQSNDSDSSTAAKLKQQLVQLSKDIRKDLAVKLNGTSVNKSRVIEQVREKEKEQKQKRVEAQYQKIKLAMESSIKGLENQYDKLKEIAEKQGFELTDEMLSTIESARSELSSALDQNDWEALKKIRDDLHNSYTELRKEAASLHVQKVQEAVTTRAGKLESVNNSRISNQTKELAQLMKDKSAEVSSQCSSSNTSSCREAVKDLQAYRKEAIAKAEEIRNQLRIEQQKRLEQAKQKANATRKKIAERKANITAAKEEIQKKREEIQQRKEGADKPSAVSDIKGRSGPSTGPTDASSAPQ